MKQPLKLPPAFTQTHAHSHASSVPEDAEVCCIRLPWVMVNNSSSRCLFPLALLLFLWLSFLFFLFFFYHFAKNKDSFAQYFNTTLCTSYMISAEHNLISTLMNALIYTLTITSPRAGLWRNGSEDPVRKMYHFDWVMLFFSPQIPRMLSFSLSCSNTQTGSCYILTQLSCFCFFIFIFFYYSFLRSQNRPISCVHTQRNTHTVTPDLNVLELLLFN